MADGKAVPCEMVGLQRQTVQSERPHLPWRLFRVWRRRDAGTILRASAFDEIDGNAFSVLDEFDCRNPCCHICGGRCFGLSKTMRHIHDELERHIDIHMDALTEKAAAHENSAFARAGRSVLVKYHDFSMSLKNRELRFLKAFPGLKVPSLRESGFVEKLREYMKKEKKGGHDKTER